MGRSPCCDKVGLKKGPWTPEEDQKLLAYIEEHGHGSWRALPAKAGLQRCGKSCRLRWTNYLRPDIKRGKFSLQEEQTIIQLHALLGNRWSAIATHLSKRTDNEIKNYWNTHLKKRLAKMGIDPVTHKPKTDAILSSEGQPKHAANLSHMAQWESARLEAEARLVRQSKLRSTTSLQNPLSKSEFASPSSSSSPLNPPILTPVAAAQPPQCLDVLKALNGVWIKANEAGSHSGGAAADGDGGPAVSVMGVSGDLESPTSTLSYSENAPQGSNVAAIGESSNAFIELIGNSSGSYEVGILKQEAEKDWKRFGNSTQLQDSMSNDISMTIESGWTQQESLEAKTEHVPCGNFVKRFTDLLLSGSGDRSFSEDDGDADNGCRRTTNGANNSDYFEDDKNYWNSILNLVNSSPSDSPVL